MPRTGSTRWHNPPPYHDSRDGVLVVRTGKDTDYWNNTFYGFLHDDGHFLGTEVSGDFTQLMTFSADYQRLYDQAGAMVYVDPATWLKCGVEFTDGAMQFSVVVTRNDQSDWSVMPLGVDVSTAVTLRLTRHAEALRIDLLGADGHWRLVRLCFLPMPETVEVGPMTCSPAGEGLEVTFSHVELTDAISRELH
jgi:regulation of enolase protein 1 (concanavalin A-like superfamily)